MEDKVGPTLGVNARVYAGQVKLLFSSQPIGIASTILNCIIMIVVFSELNLPLFSDFLGIVLLSISISRTLIAISYRDRKNEDAGARKWGWIFVLGIMFSGLAWGSSAFWIFYVKAIEFHLLIAFVIGGMVSGAAATLSALRTPFLRHRRKRQPITTPPHRTVLFRNRSGSFCITSKCSSLLTPWRICQEKGVPK